MSRRNQVHYTDSLDAMAVDMAALKAERDELREALRQIAHNKPDRDESPLKAAAFLRSMARAALKRTEGK